MYVFIFNIFNIQWNMVYRWTCVPTISHTRWYPWSSQLYFLLLFYCGFCHGKFANVNLAECTETKTVGMGLSRININLFTSRQQQIARANKNLEHSKKKKITVRKMHCKKIREAAKPWTVNRVIVRFHCTAM